MPYVIARDVSACSPAKPYAVKNKATGKVVPGGCHETRAKALAHHKALTLNVSEANPMGVKSGVDRRA